MTFSNTPPHPQPHDRADVVTTTILARIVDALRQWLHGEPATLADVRAAIENILRHEFEDLARQVRGERDDIS